MLLLIKKSLNLGISNPLLKHHTIHSEISLFLIVIPGLTRNPVFSWIPAFAGMTCFAAINDVVYKYGSIYKPKSRFQDGRYL